MKRAAKELRFEEAASLRDKMNKLKAEYLDTSEEIAEAELKAAFKPKKRPRSPQKSLK